MNVVGVSINIRAIGNSAIRTIWLARAAVDTKIGHNIGRHFSSPLSVFLHSDMSFTSPPAAAYCSLVNQASASQLVLYNASAYPPLAFPPNSVWVWRGQKWTEVNNPAVATRTNASFAYLGSSVMLFGGQNPSDVFADQENFDGQNWSQIPGNPPFGSPSARAKAMATYLSGPNQVLMFGGAMQNTSLLETWTLNPSSNVWSGPHTLSQPPWRILASLAANSATAIMFGGVVNTGGPVLGDVWAFTNNAWSQLNTTNTPPARMGHAMAFDQSRNQFVLFGGEDANGNLLSDTWIFNLQTLTWEELLPQVFPSGRTGASFCYDSTRGNSILWGGLTANGLSQETFIWNGNLWQLVQGI
jgi:galactose oxidase-like protein